MESPKYIYNLIAFSDSHIKAWETRREKEKEYTNLVNGMTYDERMEFGKRWWKKNKPDPTDTYFGKAYRGSFSDLDQLIKIIEDQNDCYGICECYYTYLLIEKHHLNCIDSVCWGDDGDEIWYKMDENYQYKRIPKPDCFKQIVSFT